jgi:hypothetical protein
MTLPLNIQIIDETTNMMKCHWKIFGGSQNILVLITDKITNRLQKLLNIQLTVGNK